MIVESSLQEKEYHPIRTFFAIKYNISRGKKNIYFLCNRHNGRNHFVWISKPSNQERYRHPLGSGVSKIIEKPLKKYSFANLRKTRFAPSDIKFGKELKNGEAFTQYIFYFDVAGQKVSGLANIPKNTKNAPVIIMFRGFVDKEIYKSGIGTKHASEIFAKNGFITVAPDFLGYGESDNPKKNAMEERFQTYTTALTLLSSIKNLPSTLSTFSTLTTPNVNKIGIWGHSNGGQIALSVLAITGSKSYPTVLWAPVGKPFPYSILYYTDEFEDHGKLLRKIVAAFEKDYDVELYSPPNYYSWIKTPIQIHQGGLDDAVPRKWSNELVEILKDLKIDVTYYTYPEEDHNFTQGNWNTLIERDIAFYKNIFSFKERKEPVQDHQ